MIIKISMNLLSSGGGQFQPEKGGQFEPESGGQFQPDSLVSLRRI
jgi:hypothetical protein